MRLRRALMAIVTVSSLALAGCSGSRPTLAPAHTAKSTSVSTTPPSTTLVAPGSSLVATALPASVAVYASPAATTKPKTTLSNPNANGAPLVFLVKKQQGAWYEVYLPIRPNGSTGWVQTEKVTVQTDPYRIVVSASEHKLTLEKNGTAAEHFTVGIGRDQYPTPGGVYYIKELLQPPNPNGAYGPYAYGLSGFTEVAELANFEGGQGVIGIHGTDNPSSVGNSISHGCIRMHNSDITKLAKVLPLGTPVTIKS